LLTGVVGVVAFVMRAWYVWAHPPVLFYGQDDTWYDAVATSLAHGQWGRVGGATAPLVFSIRFPWGYPAVLAVGQRLLFWMPPLRAHLWTSVLLGTASAVLVTILAWRMTSRATVSRRTVAAVVAGLLFAVNPLLAGAPAGLMAEVLTVPLVCGYLLLVDRVLTDRRDRWTWVGLGVTIALAALTRGESLLFLVGVTALVVAGRADRAALWKGFAGVLAAGVLAAGVWSVAVSIAAERPVFVATNSGSLLLGANCDDVLHGEARGSWSGECQALDPLLLSRRAQHALAVGPASPFGLAPQTGARVEAEISARQLRDALHAIADDPGAVLATMPVRLARGVGVYWSGAEARLTAFEGRNLTWEARGRWFHALLVLPLALVGLVAIAWRGSRLGRALGEVTERSRLVPSIAALVVWCVLVMASYGSARFRAPVEPVFALLAGVGAATFGQAWSRRRSPHPGSAPEG
jgi:hypothetical protein